MAAMPWVDIHLATLALLALVIVYSDLSALLYVLGYKRTLNKVSLLWEHRLVWAGLGVMLLSGGSMFLPGWEYYLSEPVFLVKMGFVAALVINGFFIGALVARMGEVPFAELEQSIRIRAFISGAISTASWAGAASIGWFFL